RATDPFEPARVKEIVDKVNIGPDLTTQQRKRVTELIKEYADIFALSLSEVFPVGWTKHKLNINPEYANKLPMKTHQRPITEAQKTWYANILSDMEKGGIIQKVPAEFIKCLSSTTLAPK
ncbi:hypothetical protein JB92DRAFT_2624947, partial [Gautieria morchelliformis]